MALKLRGDRTAPRSSSTGAWPTTTTCRPPSSRTSARSPRGTPRRSTSSVSSGCRSAAGMLVAGTNVVAVEFHKYAPNSTYLAFDMELSLGLTSAATPPPSPPTGVTATAIAGPKVQVGWDAVTGAASYAVLRNGTQIGTATSPGFTDNSPPSGTDAVVHRPHRRRPRSHLLRLDGGHGHDHHRRAARRTSRPRSSAARPCSWPGTPSEGRAATSCCRAGTSWPRSRARLHRSVARHRHRDVHGPRRGCHRPAVRRLRRRPR